MAMTLKGAVRVVYLLLGFIYLTKQRIYNLETEGRQKSDRERLALNTGRSATADEVARKIV